MDFLDLLLDLAGRFQSAGLNAGIDPRDINPPGVLISAAAVASTAGKVCGPVLRTSVLLVARDSGEANAYAQLGELYAVVVPVLGRDLTNEDRPFEAIQLPDSPAYLPTLRLTVQLS
jgi:hypothetical protein